jgi:hypothetical protein
MLGRRQILFQALGLTVLAALPAQGADGNLLKRFGAPKTRVQGGTRSGRGKAQPEVLLSEEPALSATAQPDLFWYLSADYGLRVELSLTPVGGTEPLLHQVQKRGAAAGIHALSLKDAGVRLAEGQDHVFALTLVPDPTVRTADVSARGTLRFAPHAPFGDARAAAAAGYWVDAFAMADPALRVALLEDVDLPRPADWLMNQAA